MNFIEHVPAHWPRIISLREAEIREARDRLCASARPLPVPVKPASAEWLRGKYRTDGARVFDRHSGAEVFADRPDRSPDTRRAAAIIREDIIAALLLPQPAKGKTA